MSMQEPGLDRHDWSTRLEALEDDIRSEPAHALPELADLVGSMLADAGYDLAEVDAAGDERDVVAEYRAAREVSDRVERGERVDPSDVGSAVQGLRAIADYLLEQRSA